jgi:hypothetical protein
MEKSIFLNDFASRAIINENEMELVGSVGSKKNASHTADSAVKIIIHSLVLYEAVPGVSFFQYRLLHIFL